MKLYESKSRNEQLAMVYGSVAFSTSLEVGMESIAKYYYDKAQALRKATKPNSKPAKPQPAR